METILDRLEQLVMAARVDEESTHVSLVDRGTGCSVVSVTREDDTNRVRRALLHFATQLD